MKASEALRIIREAVAAGFYRFSDSARAGMRGHAVLSSDVLDILDGATVVDYQQGNDTWFVEGEALSSGNRVRVVVAFEGETGIVVVSAHEILA